MFKKTKKEESVKESLKVTESVKPREFELRSVLTIKDAILVVFDAVSTGQLKGADVNSMIHNTYITSYSEGIRNNPSYLLSYLNYNFYQHHFKCFDIREPSAIKAEKQDILKKQIEQAKAAVETKAQEIEDLTRKLETL